MIGPKKAATLAVPRDCTANSAIRIDDRERHDVGVERRRRDLQAFDRGQHRQRRRDDGVAVEQRAADDAEQDYDARRDAPSARDGERHQRQRAALAVVVGAQQDQDVFGGDDEEQRPDDQRQDAEHNRFARGVAGARRRQHRFAQRVERAGADVAVDDADAAERQRPEAGFDRRVATIRGRSRAARQGGGTVGHVRPRNFAWQ